MGCKRGRKPKTDKNYRKSPKGQSLRKGESYREDKGLYYFQYRDSLNRKRVIYRKDIMALRKIEDEVKQDLADNIRTYEAAHITINDGFEQYMSIKHELKPSTRAGYIDTYNRYVRNTIGNKLLKDIKYSDAKRFYSYLLEERNLSIPTVESVQTLLHPIFSFAVRDDIIRKNPTDGIMKELKGSWNYEKKERVVLTREQAIALLDYVENHPMFYHWLTILTVLIGTGMRISELCGLRWVDVDFKKREISINHHVVYRRFEGDKKMCLHVLTPKTKKGCRIIPMHDEVYHALLAEYAHQSATGFCTAEVDGWSGFIFKNRFGGVYREGPINHAIHRVVKNYNEEEKRKAEKENREPELVPDFSSYTMRHTFCTRFHECGPDDKALQDIMGHADYRTTRETYTHSSNEAKHKAVRKLEEGERFF